MIPLKKYDITVIVPLHNTARKYFAASVESWKKQTIGFSNVEWIVVLHNCDEETVRMAHSLLDGCENVLLPELNNDVHSPSSPRNYGIEHATGDYITFLDADDRYTPECLSMALRYIKASDADVCHFRKKILMEEQVGVMLNELVLWDQTRETIVVTPRDWDMERLFVGTWCQCTSKLYRRSLLMEHHVRFDETMTMCEDALFVVDVYGLIRRLCLAPQLIGYVYYMHSGSLSQTTDMEESRVLGYVRGVKTVFDHGLANGFWMNDTLSTILLLVVLWVRSCPNLSAEVMQEIRQMMMPYILMIRPIKPSKIHENGRADRMNKYIRKVLLGQDAGFETFIDRSGDPVAIRTLDYQRDALAAILAQGQLADYGRRYGFDRLLTLEEYAERIPLTDYDLYQPIVHLMVEIGEREILTSERIVSCAIAYGSVGNPMRIPFTARGLQPYTRAFRKCLGSGETFLMLECLPYRSSNLSMDTKYTNSMIGLILTEHLSECLRESFRSVQFTSPDALLFPGQPLETEYIRLLYALRSREVETVFAVNGWVLSTGLYMLCRKWESFCDDLESGTISPVRSGLPDEICASLNETWKADPERARELRALFSAGGEPTLDRIWPRLGKVVANCTGSFAFYRKSIEKHLGNVALDNGFLSDEFAMYGMASDDGQSFTLDPFSVYYEFIPLGAESGESVLTVAQLREGECYQVIVSNLNGLYRYKTRMQLRCVRVTDMEIRVAPLCPVNYDLERMHGLREEDVQEAVLACARLLPFEIADYTFMREDDTFTLVLDPLIDPGPDPAAMPDQEALSACVGEILSRKSSFFGPQTVHVVFCEPESHILFRERECYRKHVTDSTILPCHVTDNPMICRFFHTALMSKGGM